MKKVFFSLFIIACVYSVNAQTFMTFDEAKSNDLNIAKLDSIYLRGIVMDTSIQCAFRGKESEYINAVVKLSTDASTFFNQHGFYWNDTIHTFNKLYFSKEGKLVHWFFHVKNNGLTAERMEILKPVALEFMRTYTFDLPSNSCFTQCGSITFVDGK